LTTKEPASKRRSDDEERQKINLLSPPFTGIGRQLRNAHIAFNRLFTLNLAALGISFGQFQHLQQLWIEDGITQVVLAERIGIRPAASTAVLRSLEISGHIQRVRGEDDRRKITLYLTAKGRSVKKKLLQCAGDTNEIASNGLSDDSLSFFSVILQKMVENITTAMNQAGYTRPESSRD